MTSIYKNVIIVSNDTIIGGMMLKEILKNTFLFKNADEILDACFGIISPTLKKFGKGDIVMSPTNFDLRIGFIAKGSCVVNRTSSSGNDVPLNKLTKYDSFGIVSVLSEKEQYPTEIIALESCEIVFLEKEDFWLLVNNYNQIARNVINFLTSKILFLNEKIYTFSADNVEQKLSNYILQLDESSASMILSIFCAASASL